MANENRDKGSTVNHVEGTNYGVQVGNSDPNTNVVNSCSGDNHGIQAGVIHGDVNFNH